MVGLTKKPLTLEGDYSAWTQKWATDLNAAWVEINYGAIDVDANRVFIRGEDRYAILNLADGSIIEDAAAYIVPQSTIVSLDKTVRAKYVVNIYDVDDIRVYKDGALTQTLTVAGADFMGGLIISYNGKYIIALDYTNKRLYCWEGA